MYLSVCSRKEQHIFNKNKFNNNNWLYKLFSFHFHLFRDFILFQSLILYFGVVFYSCLGCLFFRNAYAPFWGGNRTGGCVSFLHTLLFNAFHYRVTTKCSFRRMSDDEAPTSTSNSPGSTTRFISWLMSDSSSKPRVNSMR